MGEVMTMNRKTEVSRISSQANLSSKNCDVHSGQYVSKPTLVSTTGRAIERATLREFESRLLGEIIHPSDERYQLARRAWNGTLEARRPGQVVRCAAAVDVIRSVDFARSNGLAIAVRAGGHSLAGDSFCDAGMVIDVSPMKAIRVDRERRVAYAEAGLTVGEFDQATLPHGLATVLGECNSVGIAGYTIGGGLGRLMGQHAAGCENLLSAELVTANGEVSRVSVDEKCGSLLGDPGRWWEFRNSYLSRISTPSSWAGTVGSPDVSDFGSPRRPHFSRRICDEYPG
jgi:hypothetical protein